jgi:outer membrane protein TolC
MRFRVLVLSLTLAPACAWAGPPLSLERVQQLAVMGQPSVSALEANTRALRESAVAEGQLPDPRLKLGVLNVPDDSFALNRDGMTTSMIAIEQMFPGGSKRALRQRRMEAEAEQSAAEAATQRHAVQRDAVLAFLDLVGARQRLTLLAALEAEAAREVEAMRIAHAAGKGEQGEVLVARQMLVMTRDRGSELQLEAAKARAELARWIGAAADEEEVAPELPRWPPPPTLVQMREQLGRHPAHAVQARSVATAEADLALAREASSPDKSVEIGYGARSRQFGNMVSIQFSMDLPLAPKDRQQRGVAARQAQVEKAEAMREDHLRMLAAELAANHATWQVAGERLKRIDDELLPNAKQRVEAALAAYRSGRGELAAVLEARRAEIDTRLARVEVATQQARARMQLAYFEHLGEEHDAAR